MNEIFERNYKRITSDKAIEMKSFLKNFIRYHQVRFMYFYRNKNRLFLKRFKTKYGLEIYTENIGSGLYLGHAFNITINKGAVIGENCNIHKGVTIGQENRGKRKGAPTIRK